MKNDEVVVNKPYSNRAGGEPDSLRDESDLDSARENNLPEPGLAEANGGTGNSIDDFLQRLPGSFRWPKPNAEAVAAAVEAIQRISGAAAAQDLATDGRADDAGTACSSCGGSM